MTEQINRSLGSPIARGATAEIYAWEPGYILKLFTDRFDLGAVEYEARVARAVSATGLPVPAVGEILQVNGRFGLIYQRVGGISMIKNLSSRPWRLKQYARRMAEMHAEMHSAPFQADLPTQRGRLGYKITHAAPLSESLCQKALSTLALMPGGDRLCHGDFHFDNILIDGQREIIIDWVDATLGDPLADVARTTMLLIGAAETLTKNTLEKMFVRQFHAIYLRRYFQLRPGGEDIYRCWLPVTAAARLSENVSEQAEWLLKQAEQLPD